MRIIKRFEEGWLSKKMIWDYPQLPQIYITGHSVKVLRIPTMSI